jgi:hypothetical protein
MNKSFGELFISYFISNVFLQFYPVKSFLFGNDFIVTLNITVIKR